MEVLLSYNGGIIIVEKYNNLKYMEMIISKVEKNNFI